MKAFAIRGTVFVVIGLLLLHALAYVVDTVAVDGTAVLLRRDRDQVRQLLDDAPRAEALSVGNSHGDDIDFAATGYRGYHLSRAWGDVFETQYYLERLVQRLPRLQVVFIPVSYFTFFWDNASADRLVVRRSHLYNTFSSWHFIQGDLLPLLKARFEDIVPVKTVLREDNWKGILLSPGRGSDDIATEPPGSTCRHPDALAQQARLRVQEQVELTAEMVARRPEIVATTYEVLSQTVRALQSRNVRVVLFTPPYSEPYTRDYQQSSPASITLMKEKAQRIREELGVEYRDFSQDTRFAGRTELFMDSDHLNACGKRLFTKELNTSLLSSE